MKSIIFFIIGVFFGLGMFSIISVNGTKQKEEEAFKDGYAAGYQNGQKHPVEENVRKKQILNE